MYKIQLTDRMSARVCDENLLEVGTADSEDDLMTLQKLSIAGNRAVDKVTSIEKALKTC